MAVQKGQICSLFLIEAKGGHPPSPSLPQRAASLAAVRVYISVLFKKDVFSSLAASGLCGDAAGALVAARRF